MDTLGPAISSFIDRLSTLWRLKKENEHIGISHFVSIDRLSSLWLKDLEVCSYIEVFPLFGVSISSELYLIQWNLPIKHFGL